MQRDTDRAAALKQGGLDRNLMQNLCHCVIATLMVLRTRTPTASSVNVLSERASWRLALCELQLLLEVLDQPIEKFGPQNQRKSQPAQDGAAAQSTQPGEKLLRTARLRPGRPRHFQDLLDRFEDRQDLREVRRLDSDLESILQPQRVIEDPMQEVLEQIGLHVLSQDAQPAQRAVEALPSSWARLWR